MTMVSAERLWRATKQHARIWYNGPFS